MKKISKNILQILCSALFLICISSTAFAICDEEAIKSSINQSVDETASYLRVSLEAYNRATKNFEASCGEITDNYRDKPLAFNVRTLQQALSFDKTKYAYLTDMSQYENTDIKWQTIPIANDQCEGLKIKALEALDLYTTYYTKAIVVFGIAGRDQLPVSCVCPEGSNEQVCTAYTNAKIEEQQTAGKCETFATYLSSLSSCPLCPLFQVVLNTDAKIAEVAWRALSKALQNVIMVFFLAYLAFETLKIVSNFAGSNMGSYLKSILVLGTKVLLTYFLLSNSSYIYDYFISPIIKAGLDMGTSLISISSSQASVCLANNANVDFVSTPGNVLDASLLDAVMRTVRCYGHTATIMPAVGKGLICHGWANDGSFLPDFSMWFSGILFYVFGLMIWLVVSFYLIDCTVQLGIVCGLIPILVACWPFKFTTRYSIKGIQLIMNTFFNYVMLGIVLLLGVEIMDFATGKRTGTMEDFMAALNNNDLKKLQDLAGLDGIEILILIVCCIFSFKLIAMTNSLADKFSKGTGMNIGSKIGGLAASGAISAAAAGGSAGLTIGKEILQETGIPDAMSGTGTHVKDFVLDKASVFGKAIGLGKYQPIAGATGPSSVSGSLTSANMSAQANPTTDKSDTAGTKSVDTPPVERNEQGFVTLPNGQNINGLGTATRNDDGGVTFTFVGADGSKSIDSYDKDGNRSVQTFSGTGEMTSNFTQNTDGSSSGFIKKEDGTIDRWNEPAGTYKNVGTLQEKNEAETEKKT